MESFIFEGYRFRNHPVGCSCSEHGNTLSFPVVTAWKNDDLGEKGWYQGYGTSPKTRDEAASKVIAMSGGKIERADAPV